MKIDGTNIHADRVVASADIVLISHYHQDHLRGVRRNGHDTDLICSPETARLLVEFCDVPAGRIRTLRPGACIDLIDGKRRVRVTAFEANHCPGALMFLIEYGGRRILYTGDFRLDDRMRAEVSDLAGVDMLYLDTTYDDPRYGFPRIESAVEEVLSLMRGREGRNVFIAVYGIGKNRIIEAAVEEFGLPFYTTKDKLGTYRVLGMARLVTSDREATPFRAYSRGYLEHYFKMTRDYRNGESLVIIPTGWTLDNPSSESYRYVPYSEHCDYEELQEFRRLLQPKRIVPIGG